MTDNLNKKAATFLTSKARLLIKKNPKLKIFQDEIDRRLSIASDQTSRQEVLDIMYKATRNELHDKLNYIDRLIDPVLPKDA